MSDMRRHLKGGTLDEGDIFGFLNCQVLHLVSSFWTNKAEAQHGHASSTMFYCLCTGTECLQAAGWIFCWVYAPADQMLIVKLHLMWTLIKPSAKNVNNCIPRNVKLTFSILCLFFYHSKFPMFCFFVWNQTAALCNWSEEAWKSLTSGIHFGQNVPVRPH